MKIVAPVVADKDWYSKVESHAGFSTVALALQYGTTAGNPNITPTHPARAPPPAAQQDGS